MKDYLERNTTADVSVLLVWLPMFPRPQERWVLPGMVEEFDGFRQFWDDERTVSAVIKDRIVPEIEDDVPWDMFILFGPEATWATAGEHVVSWGKPVIEKTEQLDSLLASLPSNGLPE